MNSNNRYLITGATGFLGGILSHALTIGNEVIKIGKDERFGNIDITKPFHLEEDLLIDIIIHSAGKAHSIPNSRAQEKEFYDVNLEGTKNLCYAIEKLFIKPKSFIFISTVAVYGIDSGVLVNENHSLDGTTAYAQSKILAEQFLIKWAAINGIVLGILRLPLIVGPNPPGNLGSMIKGIKTGKYLSIGKAKAKKSMIWAEDIALIIPEVSKRGGTYNLTDGYHPSFNELELAISCSLKISSPMKIPVFIAKILGRLGDVFGVKFPINSNKLNKILSTLTFDDNKAKKELGWTPMKVLNKIDKII